MKLWWKISICYICVQFKLTRCFSRTTCTVCHKYVSKCTKYEKESSLENSDYTSRLKNITTYFKEYAYKITISKKKNQKRRVYTDLRFPISLQPPPTSFCKYVHSTVTSVLIARECFISYGNVTLVSERFQHLGLCKVRDLYRATPW